MTTGREDWTTLANVNVTNASITVEGDVTATVTGSVSITGTPSVAISQTGSNNTVQITGTPTVSISGTPSVSISGTPSVSISGTPAVTITSGDVTATVTGTVSISGTPAVTITSGSVTISGAVTITSGSVTATISGTPTVNIGTTNTVQISQAGAENTIQISGVTAAVTALYTAGLDTPRANQTPIAKVATAVFSTWSTIHTVTTGKTLYITQAAFSSLNPDAYKEMDIGKNSVGDFTILVQPTTTVIVSFSTPIKYTSGTVVQVYIAGTANGFISIVGWEE